MEVNSPQALHLYSLPNEVFVQILSPFTTRELLPLATVSQRFYALILRLLHYRLLLSASLVEYKLILECFHPTSKLTEPHHFCNYLGTPGLSDKHEGEGSLYENIDTAHQLGRLGSVYSIFRPVETEEEDLSVTPDSETPVGDRLTVRRTVNIEGFEDFSQLCVAVNVVKVLPGTTLLISAVNVEDGVIRLFRDWLKSQANHPQESQQYINSSSEDPNQRILWVDKSENVGLKFRVREVTTPDSNFPVLVHRDEESFSSYEISVDELHIRTTRLLLTVEQSLQEQHSYPRAVVLQQSGPR